MTAKLIKEKHALTNSICWTLFKWQWAGKQVLNTNSFNHLPPGSCQVGIFYLDLRNGSLNFGQSNYPKHF